MAMSRKVRMQHPQYRAAFVFGGGLALSLLCALLINRIEVLGVWPDIPTLYVLFFTIFGNPKGRYGPCMAIGFMRDLLSGGPLGTYAILYGLVNRFLSPRRQMLFRENPVTQMMLAAFVVFGVNMAYHASMVIVGAGIGWSNATEHSLRIAAVTGPLMPFMSFGMILLFAKLNIARLPGGNYNV